MATRYRWKVVRVPHFDLWILAGRTTTLTAIASLAEIGDQGSPTLSLVVPTSATNEFPDDQRLAIELAVAFLRLTSGPARSWASQGFIVSSSLELAAAAHLGDLAPSRVSRIIARLERETGHIDLMSRALIGGAPGMERGRDRGREVPVDKPTRRGRREGVVGDPRLRSKSDYHFAARRACSPRPSRTVTES